MTLTLYYFEIKSSSSNVLTEI